MQPSEISGLSEIADAYEAVLCDVWGVIHNGVAAHPGAVEALAAFRRRGGKVALITNAPRPHGPVREQLTLLGAGPESYDEIVTSGDVTRATIAEYGKKGGIHHIGPDRDLSLYDGLGVKLVGPDEAVAISCTGLAEDTVETPDDYRDRLAHLASRGIPMVCANPDIIVERGGEHVWCAGALARLYEEEMGQEVILVGKPFAPMYDAALAAIGHPSRDKVLAIGDAFNTDIRGANQAGIACLMVTAGIHAGEFGPAHAPDPQKVRDRLADEERHVVAYLPYLVWSGGRAR
ncbi:TIGR01459 family HAD-type hydrolase [Afifella sp. IM 167]|uniref:TIGR01459 family HAD-type hydrolase n=1 Tax=Afifella sp. IM 167 TaxID=2033586 RepID=UPI001CCD9C0E|nr:TIGR01459 family HAD-type hydrolase [Afifella sp. IM 167]MBZ8133483.1 TIGR01459 family HAD-type hydrolase [Afifella sp. IM 167]